MLIALALIAVVIGGILLILGERHTAGRLVAGGLVLAFAAPFVEAATGVLLSSLSEHGSVLLLVLLLVVVGAVVLKLRPRPGSSPGDRPSLKRRLDHDH